MFSFFWLNCRGKWLFSPRSWISNEQGPVSSFITSHPHDKPWAWRRKAAQGSLSANRDILQIVALLRVLGCYRLFSTQWLKTLHLSFELLGVLLHGGNVTFQFCKWVCSRTGPGKSWVSLSLPRVSLQQAVGSQDRCHDVKTLIPQPPFAAHLQARCVWSRWWWAEQMCSKQLQGKKHSQQNKRCLKWT